MIAIHNVVAASATVGLLGRESATLRKTILPMLYYLTVIGVLGLIAVYVIQVRTALGGLRGHVSAFYGALPLTPGTMRKGLRRSPRFDGCFMNTLSMAPCA